MMINRYGGKRGLNISNLEQGRPMTIRQGGTSSKAQTGGSRNFTEQDLAKAGLEMQRQKLQAKLQKYM